MDRVRRCTRCPPSGRRNYPTAERRMALCHWSRPGFDRHALRLVAEHKVGIPKGAHLRHVESCEFDFRRRSQLHKHALQLEERERASKRPGHTNASGDHLRDELLGVAEQNSRDSLTGLSEIRGGTDPVPTASILAI